MYVAVKGGEKAIKAAHKLLAETGRGDPSLPELTLAQIQNQLRLSVDRVQAEGALYAPQMAAMAVKQAQGDLVEAIFLIRAARASLKRFGYSEPVDTHKMQPRRRISATFKDLPGGQILGPTFDYTHRLLKRSLYEAENESAEKESQGSDQYTFENSPDHTLEKAQDNVFMAGAISFLEKEGLVETDHPGQGLIDESFKPFDLTREPLEVPLKRSGRLQALARADEGFLLSLAYSSQRGYGSVHPFVAELKLGSVEVKFMAPELNMVLTIGKIELTECQTANQFKGGAGKPPMFTRGYGLTFGHNERKALSMAIVDRALRSKELSEPIKGPAQDEEFVLYHADNVEASGFVSHIKLPHYVDFQAELSMIREMRKNFKDSVDSTADNSVPEKSPTE